MAYNHFNLRTAEIFSHNVTIPINVIIFNRPTKRTSNVILSLDLPQILSISYHNAHGTLKKPPVKPAATKRELKYNTHVKITA